MCNIPQTKNNIIESYEIIILFFYASGSPHEGSCREPLVSALPRGSCGGPILYTTGEAPYIGCYLCNIITPPCLCVQSTNMYVGSLLKKTKVIYFHEFDM